MTNLHMLRICNTLTTIVGEPLCAKSMQGSNKNTTL